MVKSKKMLALNYKATLLHWSDEKLQKAQDDLMNNAEFLQEIQKEFMSLKAELEGISAPADDAAPADANANKTTGDATSTEA